MKQKPSSKRRRNSTKSILRLPDLEHAKAAVLNSPNSVDAMRGYRHAIDEFVDWKTYFFASSGGFVGDLRLSAGVD